MPMYEVAGRPLHHNGKRLKPRAKVAMSAEDAFVLIQRGRLRTPAERPAKAGKKAQPAP